MARRFHVLALCVLVFGLLGIISSRVRGSKVVISTPTTATTNLQAAIDDGELRTNSHASAYFDLVKAAGYTDETWYGANTYASVDLSTSDWELDATNDALKYTGDATRLYSVTLRAQLFCQGTSTALPKIRIAKLVDAAWVAVGVEAPTEDVWPYVYTLNFGTTYWFQNQITLSQTVSVETDDTFRPEVACNTLTGGVWLGGANCASAGTCSERSFNIIAVVAN